MALVPCPECKTEFSSDAAVCPKCGYRTSRGTSAAPVIFVLLVLLGGFAWGLHAIGLFPKL